MRSPARVCSLRQAHLFKWWMRLSWKYPSWISVESLITVVLSIKIHSCVTTLQWHVLIRAHQTVFNIFNSLYVCMFYCSFKFTCLILHLCSSPPPARNGRWPENRHNAKIYIGYVIKTGSNILLLPVLYLLNVNQLGLVYLRYSDVVFGCDGESTLQLTHSHTHHLYIIQRQEVLSQEEVEGLWPTMSV